MTPNILRLMPIASTLIFFRARDGRMLAVRRLTAHIWHVEHEGRPIRAGSAVQVAQYMKEV